MFLRYQSSRRLLEYRSGAEAFPTGFDRQAERVGGGNSLRLDLWLHPIFIGRVLSLLGIDLCNRHRMRHPLELICGLVIALWVHDAGIAARSGADRRFSRALLQLR